MTVHAHVIRSTVRLLLLTMAAVAFPASAALASGSGSGNLGSPASVAAAPGSGCADFGLVFYIDTCVTRASARATGAGRDNSMLGDFAEPHALPAGTAYDRQDQATDISPAVIELVVSKSGALDSNLIEALSRPPVHAEPSIQGESANPVATSSNTGSGLALGWSQLGIGFGAGLGVALCLLLGVRYTRNRPLVH